MKTTRFTGTPTTRLARRLRRRAIYGNYIGIPLTDEQSLMLQELAALAPFRQEEDIAASALELGAAMLLGRDPDPILEREDLKNELGQKPLPEIDPDKMSKVSLVARAMAARYAPLLD